MLLNEDRAGQLLADDIDRLTGQTFAERRAEIDARIDGRALELARGEFRPATSENRTPSIAPAARDKARSSRKARAAKAR